MFVTIEGCEHVGKSTLVDKLATYYRPYKNTIITREPGGTPIAEAIRKVFKNNYNEVMLVPTEFYLMVAARHQHVTNVIVPALQQGKNVICDRYIDSTKVYQATHLPNTVTGNYFDDKSIPMPDITILLTANIKSLTSRWRQRNNLSLDRFDWSLDAQHIYQEEFMALAKDDKRYYIIDTSNLNPEQVFNQTINKIRSFNDGK